MMSAKAVMTKVLEFVNKFNKIAKAQKNDKLQTPQLTSHNGKLPGGGIGKSPNHTHHEKTNKKTSHKIQPTTNVST